MNDLFVGLALYIGAYGLLSFMFFSMIYNENSDTFYFLPTHVYESSKLNIVGCLLLSIIYIMINPLYCLYMILYIIVNYIYSFVYWLLHVGRKED